jgi:hypothetical protein
MANVNANTYVFNFLMPFQFLRMHRIRGFHAYLQDLRYP